MRGVIGLPLAWPLDDQRRQRLKGLKTYAVLADVANFAKANERRLALGQGHFEPICLAGAEKQCSDLIVQCEADSVEASVYGLRQDGLRVVNEQPYRPSDRVARPTAAFSHTASPRSLVCLREPRHQVSAHRRYHLLPTLKRSQSPSICSRAGWYQSDTRLNAVAQSERDEECVRAVLYRYPCSCARTLQRLSSRHRKG